MQHINISIKRMYNLKHHKNAQNQKGIIITLYTELYHAFNRAEKTVTVSSLHDGVY